MDSSSSNSRAEAERCLGLSEKLLMARDLVGSKNLANRAHHHDPLLEGVDQIVAVADVLLSAEKRINNHMDWYAILQLNPHSNDLLDSMKKQYHKLARLLYPDKNHCFGADNAFKLVVDAWAVLSDPSKKGLYDKEINIALDLNKSMPSSTIHGVDDNPDSRIWTSCPYCCNLYEYAKDYENCRLRCQNCRRGFHAVAIPALPPIVPGMDAYYCSWGFFPLGVWGPNSHVGFGGGGGGGGGGAADSKSGENVGFSSWKPFFPMFAGSFQPGEMRDGKADQREGSMNVPHWNGDSAAEVGSREKTGAAGVSEEVYSSKMPKGRTNEEPLLAVPISMRPPKKKKVAKKAKKQTGGKDKGDVLGKGSMQDSERQESNGNVGENIETGNGVDDPAVGIACSEKAGDCQVPVEKVGEAGSEEFRDDNIESDPVDIPSLLKLLGVKDEEMDKPFSDFGAWDK